MFMHIQRTGSRVFDRWTPPAARGTAAREDAGVSAAARARTDQRVTWLLRGMLGLIALAIVVWTDADVDLWGHVRFGEDILSLHALPVHDPYSFTSDKQWL